MGFDSHPSIVLCLSCVISCIDCGGHTETNIYCELCQTIISGMGELHLDIYVERIRREYKVFIHIWKPHFRSFIVLMFCL
jgi:hypothetical protein